jgi:hypothetical protein
LRRPPWSTAALHGRRQGRRYGAILASS